MEVVVGSCWLTVVTFYSLDPRMGMVGSAVVGTLAADSGASRLMLILV